MARPGVAGLGKAGSSNKAMEREKSMFKPKGDRKEADILFELIGTEIGRVITYEEMSAALGREIRARRLPIYQVQRRLERECSRTIECVLGKGYRIAEPSHHEELGRKQHRKSRRALGRALAKFVSADRSLLKPDQVQRVEAGTRIVGEMFTSICRLELVAKEHKRAIEAVVSATTESNEVLSQRISVVEEALRKGGLSKKKKP